MLIEYTGLMCWATLADGLDARLVLRRRQNKHSVASCSASCNYLQATDMEMETVDGYKSTSWEAGYGDYVMKPDLGTLRRVPWLGGTALVLCDVLDHHTLIELLQPLA